jgi:uncharacterized protein (TIGR00730 family)
MHERKALMSDLSDGFIAIPGGLGTLEEFFEVLTWGQLGFHEKPVALYNVDGYFDGLLEFLQHAVSAEFIRPEHKEILIASTDAATTLERFSSYTPPKLEKWIGRSEL